MNKNKKIFSTFILSMFLIQASFVPVALASSLNYDNPNSGSSPYKISLSTVLSSGMLMSLVGCTGIVNKVAAATTQFITDKINYQVEKTALSVKLTSAKFTSVPSVDANSAKEVLSVQQQQDKRDKARELTTNCINGIATTLAKNQLTAMTKSTMNWITTGFNGDPMYVRDVDSYLNNLTVDLLNTDTSWFKDPANSSDYPYGRDYALGQINTYKASKNEFGSLKQDLVNYLEPGATIQDFSTDFSQGGWNGWLALTQHSQNNPLGFTLEATDNLAKKKDALLANTKDEIARSGGIFDQKKCDEWQVADASGKRLYNPDGTASTTTNGSQSNTSLCTKYEIVTPGSLIRGKVDTYLNSPERQLELAKTLNDALNALFSSLIGKFQDQGLSSLGSGTSAPVSGGFGSNSIVDLLGNNISGGNNNNSNSGSFDLTQDLGNTYINAVDDGKWNANTNTPQLMSGVGTNGHYYKVGTAGNTMISPSVSYWSVGDRAFFDGTEWKKGVPQYVINKKGVIQIEQDYIDSINKAKTVLLTILPSIGKLDYCIPGPNPSWHNLNQESIASYIETLNTNPTSSADQFNQNITNYENLVNQTYGINSSMQNETPGNTDFLQMSPAGLSITKDIGIYADNVTTGQEEYANLLTTSNTNISKLNTLKDKVNLIISAAQARRHTKRIQEGLPPVSNLCTTTEKVTYISNGVLK